VRKAELGADVGCCACEVGVCSSTNLSIDECVCDEGGLDVKSNGVKKIELLLM
jgi:hypothetical protein